MGRRARPVELMILDGKHKKAKADILRRQQAEDELRPKAEKLEPPDWLSEAACAEWRRILALQTQARVITEADISTLAIHCDAVVRYAEAIRQLNGEGMVVEGRRHPLVDVVDKLARMIDRTSRALGLDPSARASLARQKALAQKSDAFEEMFG